MRSYEPMLVHSFARTAASITRQVAMKDYTGQLEEILLSIIQAHHNAPPFGHGYFRLVGQRIEQAERRLKTEQMSRAAPAGGSSSGVQRQDAADPVELMSIHVWAERAFRGAKPHENTVRRWARAGKLRPAAVRVGRAYFVYPCTVYTDDAVGSSGEDDAAAETSLWDRMTRPGPLRR